MNLRDLEDRLLAADEPNDDVWERILGTHEGRDDRPHRLSTEPLNGPRTIRLAHRGRYN
jgi:hypothetical protein